jgi:hypothetical protein
MTRRREDLIRELAIDPAVPGGSSAVGGRTLRWLGTASLIALVAMVSRQPMRDSWLLQLVAAPRQVLELVFGLLAVVAASLAAFRSGVPSATSPLRQASWAVVFALGWLALLVIRALGGDVPYDPDLKRSHCWLEVLAYGTPGLLVGLAAVRRLWPLHGAWSGALLGFAAGAIPALLMHLACLPGATHAIAFHLGPAVALAAAGGLAGARLLRRP